MLIKTQKYNVPVFKKGVPDDSYKFQPIPAPSGPYPYHLALEDFQAISDPEKLVFHMLGDSGSLRNTDFLKGVTAQLAKQFSDDDTEKNNPRFLYHLGDVVYNHGEAAEYQRQFFEPFRDYPAPIVAIPGNHDSDVNPDSKPYESLDAFRAVFCSTARAVVPFSGSADRKSMMQPHVYWTLETPLANIIGIYSNVPKFGVITSEQRQWLLEELRSADRQRPDRALILCLHHSPYSADINHGSSEKMIRFLESVFEESGVKPDIVFSAHVHNYQRFVKTYDDGTDTIYVVAGAGGYDELHPVALRDDPFFTDESPLLENIELQKYCDDLRGFLKITLRKTGEGVRVEGEYFVIQTDAADKSVVSLALADSFFVKSTKVAES